MSSSLSSKFSTAETGVFWDLDVCPIPNGLSALTIAANIKLALENMGYTGKISIVAYSVKKHSEEEEVEFESAQIKLIQQLATRLQEKVNMMYKNLLMWGIEHRYEPTNVMVISDELSPKEADLVSAIVILKKKENNILFAQPRGLPLPLPDTATSTWLWESLATGGSPLDGHSMRPEPSPTCSFCSAWAIRLANKRKNRPTKPSCLKRRKSSGTENLEPDG